MIDLWDAKQRGLSIDYNTLAPWVFEGLRVFEAALESANRLTAAHQALEAKVLGRG